MQLLGKGDEIAQLPKLHVGHPRSVLPRSRAGAVDLCRARHGTKTVARPCDGVAHHPG
jgi:hypothetical protein